MEFFCSLICSQFTLIISCRCFTPDINQACVHKPDWSGKVSWLPIVVTHWLSSTLCDYDPHSSRTCAETCSYLCIGTLHYFVQMCRLLCGAGCLELLVALALSLMAARIGGMVNWVAPAIVTDYCSSELLHVSAGLHLRPVLQTSFCWS